MLPRAKLTFQFSRKCQIQFSQIQQTVKNLGFGNMGLGSDDLDQMCKIMRS